MSRKKTNDKMVRDFQDVSIQNYNSDQISNNKNIKTSKKKKKSKKRKVLKVILIIIIIIGIIIGAISALVVSLIKGGAVGEFLTKAMGGTYRGNEPVYVLVLGVNPPLSDTIMLVGYNPESGEVSSLSIPRDTYIPDVITNKVNAVYSTNGGYNKDSKSANYEKAEKAMLSQVEEITGIYADYYITLDTNALVEIIDAIGGVTVDVEINMKYDDPSQNLHINLKKGTQVLNGKQAEGYVRFRKNNDGTGYPNGDIGRVAAQQKFIKAVIKQILKAENVTKIGNFIEIGMNNVKTNISLADAMQYVDDIANFDMNKLKMETLPKLEDPKKLAKYKNANQACYFWDEEKAKELCQELFFENDGDNTNSTQEKNQVQGDEKVSKSDLKIEVLNGSSNSKNLSKVTKLLTDEGYNVSNVGTTDSTSKTKIIINLDTDEIENIKRILGTKNTQKNDDGAELAHITIIIGDDYK